MEESLLAQVRVAAVGQEIDAWVLGRTRVRFLVGACSWAHPVAAPFPHLAGGRTSFEGCF